MKGIILAGGSGSRLAPLTTCTSKQLLPVFDKPMIYYPLSVLMQSGIREVLLITTPVDQDRFRALLGDGSSFGIELSYVVQTEPRGLADAFILGADFIGSGPVTLILGDNLFHGDGLSTMLQDAQASNSGATIFSSHVDRAERYGVVCLDGTGKPVSIEEKPRAPKSNLAVTGLYVYDNSVLGIAKTVKPSARGELEITDVNRSYMLQGSLSVTQLSRDIAWLDTGTAEALLEASEFVRSLQHRHGLQIACLEEIGLQRGWLDIQMVEKASSLTRSSGYGIYLQKVCDNYKK
ncbi:MAG: glucose-1-phosphate thymidylyltransferase RfbA [Maricaulis sp.]|nr:glucose-1-phosphate thymidylyltransferase RfbA [Maricaulis sp.]